MPKITLTSVVLGVLLMLVLAPVAVFAQGAPKQPNACCQLSTDVSNIDSQCEQGKIVGPSTDAHCDLGTIDNTTTAWGMCCTVDILNTVTNWLFYIMMIVAVLLVLVGGIIFMFAGGNAEAAGKGKGFIIYAIIGLAIGLLAKTIPAIVAFIIK